VTLIELQSEVSKIEPSLSAEGKMLVGLFMPFCEEQQLRIKELEDKLAVNSANSSKPPSKDDFKSPKKRSLRVKTNKKPGGQPGHKGQGGKLRDNPDKTLLYKLGACPDCGVDLQNQALDEVIRKQVEDLPPIRTIVTEHQIEIKTCPCCQQQWQAGGCPKHIRHEFQYGPRIKALSVYLSAYQFLPAKRIKDLLAIFGIELSTGTLDNFRKSASGELSCFIDTLRQSIIEATAVFFDETGMKVKGLGHWVHVAATSLFSLFMLHLSRGRQAHQAMGVLPFFKGILHRDDYHSYRTYPDATHSLCCAHLLRDLKYAIDRDAQKEWADPMIDLLIKIKIQVDNSATGVLDIRWQGRHRKKYRQLVELGLLRNPPVLKTSGKIRGPTAQAKTCNLLLRFKKSEDQILRFMTHTHALFDNNQAERDLRMNKVRQKISGGFRPLQAGEEFMRIRSFVATAIKRGHDPVESLVSLFTPGNKDYMELARNPE
jgi:transposase